MDRKQILTKEFLRLRQQEAELCLSYNKKMLQIHSHRDTILSELLPDCYPNKSVTEILEKSSSKAHGENTTKNINQTPMRKLTDINEDDFDVILDMKTGSLRYRKDPVKHTQLKEANLKNIGRTRISILQYLLENPERTVSVVNVSLLPNQQNTMEPNTLSKTISLLRRALEQTGSEDTYILTKEIWGGRCRFAYKWNEKRKCLVIK